MQVRIAIGKGISDKVVENIFLKKDIVEMESITSEGVMVYVALSYISSNRNSAIYTTMNLIELSLKNNGFEFNKAIKEKIKCGLVNLQENNILKVYCNGNINKLKPKDEIIIKPLNTCIDTKIEHFTIITIQELSKIMNYSSKIDTDKLIRYYITLIGTINNNTKVGFTPIEALADKSFVSESSIKTYYNNILEELELIYIHRGNKCIRNKDGSASNLGNTYGRYENKDLVIKNANEYYNNTYINNNLDGNWARSTKQKYNSMIKKINNNIEVDPIDIIAMNERIRLYNDKYKYDDMIKLKEISFNNSIGV